MTAFQPRGALPLEAVFDLSLSSLSLRIYAIIGAFADLHGDAFDLPVRSLGVLTDAPDETQNGVVCASLSALQRRGLIAYELDQGIIRIQRNHTYVARWNPKHLDRSAALIARFVETLR